MSYGIVDRFGLRERSSTVKSEKFHSFGEISVTYLFLRSNDVPCLNSLSNVSQWSLGPDEFGMFFAAL